MNLSKETFSGYIKDFQFKELFNDMGWNNDKVNQPISIDSQTYALEGMAQKSGFKILRCSPGADGGIPEYSLRRKIDHKTTKLYPEHLIIYTDSKNTEQVWQRTVRQLGKPDKVTETRYKISQSPELLYQRASGLFFTLDEEEQDKITIVEVTDRFAKNFEKNSEKVTKKFYDGFQKQHEAFLGFIKGIQAQGDREWYASLMLNRLMFCYFIQKKGFLDNNDKYLRVKLDACKSRKGKFYSFYRSFLLALFHQGLGAPSRSKELQVEIGKVPYLNGGLFDEHEIEKLNKTIDIEDSAFEKLFNFFDEWEWHLDTRGEASGKEINPDVIGYIFEKYINDRAQMGAYYTKEDITDYIGKNCIIPFLFDETNRNYPDAFTPGGPVWKHVQESGDTYIYDAFKKGVPDEKELFTDLPLEIQIGIDPELENRVVDENGPFLSDLRKDWNQLAPSKIALPTEIYREVIDRRKRCAEIRKKISSGQISTVNDFITYNLNLGQFAQNLLEEINDPKFIREFYESLCKVTILDPTCGSGAFLFAALNILEPLYEACIMRMRAFVDDEDRSNLAAKRPFGNEHKIFRQILAAVKNEQHPNETYFIYKSIILNNLYGVDFMREAVEIAKLRLFLKLVATVDADYRKPNLGLEPLPDVDFNIRAGNTLIGYATKNQVDGIAGFFITEKQKKKVLEECDVVAHAFARYKEIQLSTGDNYNGFRSAKEDLNKQLHSLTDGLNTALYSEQYNGDDITGKDYRNWLNTHRPFHWFAEFYEIIEARGGFDVIIGNPPYVEYKTVLDKYTIPNLETEACGNLYAFVIEKSFALARPKGRLGLIVPISLTAAQRMVPLQKLITENSSILHLSSFGLRPAALFPGIMQRLTILTAQKGEKGPVFTSDYITWYAEEREVLFSVLKFFPLGAIRLSYSIPKMNSSVAYSALTKIFSRKRQWNHHNQFRGEHRIYYHNAGGYWIKTFDFRPYYRSLKNKDKKHTTISELCLPSKDLAFTYLGILSSSLFYFFWKSLTDARHIYPSDIALLPIDLPLSSGNLHSVQACGEKLMLALKQNRKRITYGDAEVDQFYVTPCKPIIDEIDKLLALSYGFTQNELDFIINYDIKYRMGKSGGDQFEDE